MDQYNRDYLVGGRSPLGLAYLAAVLRQEGHEVLIIDRAPAHFRAGFQREPVDRLTRRALLDFDPDIIGISTLTGIFSDACHVARLVRSLPGFGDRPLVMGGFHATVEAESVLEECPEADMVIAGEAEYSFRDFVNGVPPEQVPGATLRLQHGPERFLHVPRQPLPHSLDELPFPARDLLDMDFYISSNSSAVPGLHTEPATFISSRGCMGRCFFCGASRMSPRVRSHSAEYVIREIEHVIGAYPVSCIVFADQMFLTNKRRVRRFCEMMIARGLSREVVWTANARADVVDRETLALMKEAGCVWLCFGFESGSQRMLDLCNKRTTVAQNIAAAQMAKENGILVSASMIAGMPGETEEDFAASMDFLEQIQPDNAGFNLFTPLPGCEFYYRLIQEGKLDRRRMNWREVGMLNVGKSRSFCQIPLERLHHLIQEANQKISRRTNQLYYQYNFLKNQTQAVIRLRYNGQEPDLAAEPCYRHFRAARRAVGRGEYQQAVELFHQALASRPCLLNCPCPTGCPFYFQLQAELCQVLWGLGRYQEVGEVCREVLSVRRPVEGCGRAFFLRFLALACYCLGRGEEADEAVTRYRELCQAGKETAPAFVLEGADEQPLPPAGGEEPPITWESWELTPEAGPLSRQYERVLHLCCSPGQYDYLAQSPPLDLAAGVYRLTYQVALEQGGLTVGVLHPRRGWLVTCNHAESGEGHLVLELTWGSRGLRVVVAACTTGQGQPVEGKVEGLHLSRVSKGGATRWRLLTREAGRRLRNWEREKLLPRRALLRVEAERWRGRMTNRRARSQGARLRYRVVDVAPAGYAIRGIALLEGETGRGLVTADVGDDTLSFFPLQGDGRLGERRVLRLPYRITPIHLAVLPDSRKGDRLLVCLFNFGGGQRIPRSYLVEIPELASLLKAEAVEEVERELHVLLQRDGICGFRGVAAWRSEAGDYLIASVDRDRSRFHLLQGRLEGALLSPQERRLELGQGREPIGLVLHRLGPGAEGAVCYLGLRGQPEVLAVKCAWEAAPHLAQVYPLPHPSRSSLAVVEPPAGGGGHRLALAHWGGDPRELNSVERGELLLVDLDRQGALGGLAVSPAGVHPTDVVAGDFDGDGEVEVAVLNYGSGLGPRDRRHPGGVEIYKDQGGVYRRVARLALPNPRIGAAVDVDRDGVVELVVSLFFERRLVVIKAV